MSFSAPDRSSWSALASKLQEASADLARLDDVLHYGRDWRFAARRRPAPIESSRRPAV